VSIRFFVYTDYFRHHFLVDVQAAGRVDDQHVGMVSSALVQCAFHDRFRTLRAGALTMQGAHLCRQCLQLQYGGRTMHIDAHEHDALPVGFDQLSCELGRSRRLAGTL
jgi:hypothetical protein